MAKPAGKVSAPAKRVFHKAKARPLHQKEDFSFEKTKAVPAEWAKKDLCAADAGKGKWLWLCRVDFERDVCEELALQGCAAQPLLKGVVVSNKPAKQLEDLVFARQGLPVDAVLPADADAVSLHLAKNKKKSLVLQVFSPDSDEGNTWTKPIQVLHSALTQKLLSQGVTLLSDGTLAHEAGGEVLHVCFVKPDQVVVGSTAARSTLSLSPGGKQRFRRPVDAPSRSSLKLVEALDWLGHAPEPGEVCVDLGAAPGGWSQVLLQRKCVVVAVDLGKLSPDVATKVEHVRMNAFTFSPEIPADWLFCDLAYRPLEVATLLAKWGRRNWARFVVANLKLPMKQRVHIIQRVRSLLAAGGWTRIRLRQLYHDRDEVTVTAWRKFGGAS